MDLFPTPDTPVSEESWGNRVTLPVPVQASAREERTLPAHPAPQQSARVLHVINGEHFAGAERVQDLLAMRLPDHGFDVGFVALKAGRFGDVRRSIKSPLAELSMASRWDLRAVSFVVRMARDGDYQLLHAHTPRTAMIAAIAARWTGLPFVYHVHSPTSRDSTRWLRNWINDRVERWSVRGAGRLITVSPTLTSHMEAQGVESSRLECVLNGVPAIAESQPRSKPDGNWMLGMVALFRPRKGAELLLESLAAVRSQGHDVRLRMIGPFETPTYGKQLKQLCRTLGLHNAVHWTGFTDNVAEELTKVDALALPSLFGEGLPMVVLEAMASALPVVATRCEGVAQAVIHRQTGLLVEPASVDSLSEALEELVGDRLDYEAMSRRAWLRHAAEFSDDVMASRVAEVYRDVLKNR